MEKETDPRVHEFKLAFVAKYRFEYKIEPNWNGKQAKHTSDMWKRIDKNKIDPTEVYTVLDLFFSKSEDFTKTTKHDPVYFCNNFEKLLLKRRELQVKTVFKPEPIKMDEKLKVVPKTLPEIIEHIKNYYKTPNELVKRLKYLKEHTVSVREKKGNIFEQWVRDWKIGCQLWGADVMKTLWDGPEKKKMDLNQQIRQAKEVEK